MLKGHYGLSPSGVLWIIRGVLLGVWLTALSILVCQLCHVCMHPSLAEHDRHSFAGQRCMAWVDALNRKSTLGIAVRLVLLVAPPAFYLQVAISPPSPSFHGLL